MRLRGPWSLAQIHDYLDRSVIPVRLGCTSGRGTPLVASHWFVRDGDDLLCAVQSGSVVARWLTDNPKCGFEISRDAPPYFGVRGNGLAHLERDRAVEVLERLIERYLDDPDARLARWLRSRADEEVAVRIRPWMLYSWDYRSRMA